MSAHKGNGNKNAKKENACTERITFLQTREKYLQYKKSAEERSLSLSEWIKDTLDDLDGNDNFLPVMEAVMGKISGIHAIRRGRSTSLCGLKSTWRITGFYVKPTVNTVTCKLCGDILLRII